MSSKKVAGASSSKESQTREQGAPSTLLPKLRFPEFRDAARWDVTILGELSEVVRGGSPRPIDAFMTTSADGLNWLKIGDVDKEAKFVTQTAEKVRREALNKTRVVNPGDLILSNSMSFGRPYILQITTCIHDGWIASTKISKTIDRDFFYYLILAPGSQSYFLDNAAGSGVLNLNADIITALRVCFPKRPEQQKIAECLSSVDELLAAQARKVNALKTHKRGLMQQLFPREGETQPRLRFPDFQSAGEWETKRVDERGNVLAGKALAVNAPGPLRPYLRTRNVLDGAIDLSDVLTMPMTDAEFSRFEVLDGDILLNEGQSLGLVGRASIYRGEFGQRCAMQNALLRFRAFPSTCPEFAAQAFQQCQKDGTFASIATQTTSVAHLGSSRFSALELAWPLTFAEQQRIATCLSSLDALITAETQKHAALKTHKKGLMQQLFTSPDERKSL